MGEHQSEPTGETRSSPAAGMGPQRSVGEDCCPLSDHGPGAAVGQPAWQVEGRTDRGGGSCKDELNLPVGSLHPSLTASHHNNLHRIKATLSFPP